MTKSMLLANASSYELAEWQALTRIEAAEEADREAKRKAEGM